MQFYQYICVSLSGQYNLYVFISGFLLRASNRKIIFLFLIQKNMLWVVKRIGVMRRSFERQKLMLKSMYNFTLIY